MLWTEFLGGDMHVRAGVGFILAGILALGVRAAEDYRYWACSARLSMDTSPKGADVGAMVTDFPVLVRLAAPEFPFSQAQGKGQDIRFSKLDGTHLAYSIDNWDSSAGRAEIWVRMDTVRGNVAGQVFQLHWSKTDAADNSDGGSVFENGYAGVWHLGGDGSSARPNAVSKAPRALPVNYRGRESIPGIIGLADSLDRATPGSYLNLGNGYSDFSEGFTFSTWAYPTEARSSTLFLDLGNGAGSDNIVVMLDADTRGLRFENHTGGGAYSMVGVAGVISMNQWQHLAVTVTDKTVRLYRNGVLQGSSLLSTPIRATRRMSNFIGNSNWDRDGYFRGSLDQPEISRVSRKDAWIKLGYENQQPNQSLITLQSMDTVSCGIRFGVASEISASEGDRLSITGQADCSDRFGWTVVSGPAPRILDPDSKVLQLTLPRVQKDTVLVFRFTARIGKESHSQDVRVSVKKTIPDPLFTVPATFSWNGREPLTIRPLLINLKELESSRTSEIRFAWTLSGMEADTVLLDRALQLQPTSTDGILTVGLCLDNGGPVTCKEVKVEVTNPTALHPRMKERFSHRAEKLHGRDAIGRRIHPSHSPLPISLPPYPLD